MSAKEFKHVPVLLKEAIEFLNVKAGGTYVDGTLGGGGHTEAIIQPSDDYLIKQKKSFSPLPRGRCRVPIYRDETEGVRVIAFDLDKEAITAAKQKLAAYNNITYINDNFVNLKKHLQQPVDGFLFDLGVSSHQIDTASRGFSIREDGPLDMRMASQKLSAKDIVNKFKEEDLAKIFFQFGEEKFSRRIAKRIAAERTKAPIATTFQLKKIIEQAIPTWKKRESVTRVFQALRIAVNQELDNLKAALQDAIELLKPGGRIVVISYHSLEDRIVKHTFKQSQLTILTKKPVPASEAETAANPRAKSAKLRAGEKLNAQISQI